MRPGYAARRIASQTSREKRKPGTGRALAAFDGDLRQLDGVRRADEDRSEAGPRRPSDGKLGGLLRPTPMLYGEAELTESSGSVSLTKGEAVSRLALRLSPMPNGGTIPAVLDG